MWGARGVPAEDEDDDVRFRVAGDFWVAKVTVMRQQQRGKKSKSRRR